jgi:hypothetical protein
MRVVKPIHCDLTPQTRREFRFWLNSGDVAIASLYEALLRRAWRPAEAVYPPVEYRLRGEDLAALKARVVERVELAGGTVRLARLVLTVADGTLKTELLT